MEPLCIHKHFFLYTGVQVQWLELAVETKRFIVTPKNIHLTAFADVGSAKLSADGS